MPASAASPKTLARVEKLLRLAAPGSNASEHERVVAALEIVRLVIEGDLRLIAPRQNREKNQEWKSCIAARDDRCTYCWGDISIGEKILGKSLIFGTQYAHLACASDQK